MTEPETPSLDQSAAEMAAVLKAILEELKEIKGAIKAVARSQAHLATKQPRDKS
jgi:hypothetical protein